MFIVNNRNWFYVLSALLTGAALFAIVFWGLKFGIDFEGGSLLEVTYPNGRPEVTVINDKLTALDLRGSSARPTGDDGFIIRTPFLEEDARQALIASLSNNGTTPIVEKRFDSIGPTLGTELANKAGLSLGLVILAIVIFVTFAFRKVSEPVSSWKYGVITIIALVHDVIIPTGAFAALGYFLGYEVDALFVTALLVILGFSVHDTIVVFDRVRENLRVNAEKNRKEAFDEVVGKSIAQTFNRSINTSLTTLLALAALYFFGSETTQHFTLALLIGIAAGTFSSIFLASPLLVTAERLQTK